jgi:orotidine-5'-phosphate decarboxylase
MKIGFREKLKKRQKKVDSLLCVGLDPLADKIPTCVKSRSYATATDISSFLVSIIDITVPFASMFKPQRAHFESINEGENILRTIIHYIHAKYPDIPIFLDCKRGDIGRTQGRYKEAHFGLDGADGMNFSPYMGKDCMQYLVDPNDLGKALVGLCYTSNPSSREVQDIGLVDGRRYWEFIAETTLKWAKELDIVCNAGLVMAAAYENPKGSGEIYSYHLERCREIVGDELWFLIPGVGTQGGYIKETIKASYKGPGSIAINSSSGILCASNGEDYAEAAAAEAKRLRDEMRIAVEAI